MLRWGWLLIVVAISLLAACEPQPNITDGPQLVRQVTVGPTDLLATRAITDTPMPTATINATENISPLAGVTVDSQFVVITPTLPPSKTPTPTATFTPTLTPTPTNTPTSLPTSTTFLLPTSEIIAITQPAFVPNNQVCDSNWTFIQPPPPSCPQGPPNASTGTYQRFPNGHMIEISNQSAIYVLYANSGQPTWQVFRDYFQEGMPETSPAYPPEQPIRGFGLVWRDDANVRNRLGYLPIQRHEAPYSIQVQISRDGTIFITGDLRAVDSRYNDAPSRFTFALFPDAASWQDYSNNTTPLPVGGTVIPSLP